MLYQKYISWKGTGIYSNNIGITSGNIRPLTNNDVTNNASQKHGLPRPIKQYRKGITTISTNATNINNSRQIPSTVACKLIHQLIDIPGGFSIKNNKIDILQKCDICQGIDIINDWKPITNLTEKPELNSQTNLFCCNLEKNAIKRCLPTSSNITKNTNLIIWFL